MRKILVPLMLVMVLTFPVFAQAQDVTDPAPTQEVATLEASQTPDVVTATPSPTPDVTATPVPPVEPPPIDQTKVFESIFSVVMALVVGAVLVTLTGIVGLLMILSPAVRAVLMGGIKVGIDEAGKVAEKTETKVDDMAVEELRKLYIEIEKRLRVAEDQGNVNAQDIATTNRAVSQAISNR